MNDETRAFSRRYFDKMQKMPNMTQAGVYSSTLHYLKAAAAAETVEASAVLKMMRATPINDFFAHDGRIREDGRMVHDMYLFEVKKPSRSSSLGTTTNSWRPSRPRKPSSRCRNLLARW